MRVAPKLRFASERPKLPTEPLVIWLDAYRARAEHGDADAAYLLNFALQRCVPPDAMRAQVGAQLEASALKAARDDAARAKLAEAQAAARRETIAFCAGVPPPTPRDAFAMLELAAQLGNPESVFDYINTPPHLALGWAAGAPTEAELQEHARISRRQYELAQEAQARGSEAAIYWLAWRAETGTTADGTEDAAARDPVAAYAGFIAYRMIRLATQRGIDYGTEQSIAELELELRPEQLDAAMQRAFAIVGDPDCCMVQ